MLLITLRLNNHDKKEMFYINNKLYHASLQNNSFSVSYHKYGNNISGYIYCWSLPDFYVSGGGGDAAAPQIPQILHLGDGTL